MFVIRSRYYQVGGGALGGVTALGVAIAAAPESVPVAVCAVLIGTATMRRIWRVTLAGIGDDLHVVNVLRSHVVPWHDVVRIEVGDVWWGRTPTSALVVCTPRRSITAVATMAYTRHRAEHICALVSAAARVRGVPCDLDPARLRSRVA